MGKRRKKQGLEEAIAGFVMLFGVYLAVTHRLAHAINALLVLAVLAAVGYVCFLLFRRPRDSPTPSRLTPGYRREPAFDPMARSAQPANSEPVVLDRKHEHQATERRASQPTASRSWSIGLIRELEWKRFEELCEGFWKAKGYRAEPTGRGADGGIDVNLYRPSDPGKLLAIIQCKSRSQDQIGVAFVRELFGVMHHVNAPMGILMASTGFHEPAREFAAGKHLQLLDGESILKQLSELPSDESCRLLEHVTRGDYITPTCPSCDEKMIRRTSKVKGTDFYGCRNFPRCRQTFYPR